MTIKKLHPDIQKAVMEFKRKTLGIGICKCETCNDKQIRQDFGSKYDKLPSFLKKQAG